LLEKALSLAKDILDENDLQLAQIYALLANALTKTAKYEEAETMIRSSLLLQKEHPKTERYIETLIEQASLTHIKSEYANAIVILLEAIAIARDLLSNTHPFWGNLFNNLAAAMTDVGDYETALMHYKKAQNQPTLTPIERAVTLYNVANTYAFLYKVAEARENAETALNVFEENLPSNHKYINNTRQLLEYIETAQKGGQQ